MNMNLSISRHLAHPSPRDPITPRVRQPSPTDLPRRRRRSRSPSLATTLVDEAKCGLEEAGMDLTRLSKAFRRLDSEGDGLDLFEFRNMWKKVFPQRPMDEGAWRYTDRMFQEIDNDGSGMVTLEEILSYLHKSQKQEKRKQIPVDFKSWVSRFAGKVDPEERYVTSQMCIGICVGVYRIFSLLMVLLSVIVLMIETLPETQSPDRTELTGNSTTFALEATCVAVFTLEFLAWAYSYPHREIETTEEGKAAKQAKWRFFFSEFATWVDLLSILPFYLMLIDDSLRYLAPVVSIRVLRLLRLLRIVRVLILMRGTVVSRAPELGAALRKSLMSLWFLVLLIIISVCLSSSFIFYAEQEEAHFNSTLQKWIRDHDSQYPDAGSPTSFQSIPESLWWGVVTITTVGYGDYYPVTIGGKVVASCTMLAGLIVVGYPITILTSTFQAMEMEQQEQIEKEVRCTEFYYGIRNWLESQELEEEEADMGSEGSAAGRRFSAAMRRRMSSSAQAAPTPSFREIASSPRAGGSVSVGNTIDQLYQMETRITRTLGRLDARIRLLEKSVLDAPDAASPFTSPVRNGANHDASTPDESPAAATLPIPSQRSNEPYGVDDEELRVVIPAE